MVLFVVLATAIAMFQLGAFSSALDWVREGGFTTPSQAQRMLEARQDDTQRDFEHSVDEFKAAQRAKLKSELDQRKTRRSELNEALAREPSFLDAYNPSAILERQSLTLELQLIESEISILESRIELRDAQLPLAVLQAPTLGAIEAAQRRCELANKQVRDFNDRSLWGKRYRNWRDNEADNLTRAARQACGRYTALRRERTDGIRAARDRRAAINRVEARIEQLEREGTERIESFSPEGLGINMSDVLLKAAIGLFLIIAMPFVIRAFFYFVLAPLAERRASIRIVLPIGAGEAIAPTGPSKVSISVELQNNEELLVRQGYLQTTGLGGHKSTRTLLDFRHPFSSIASGLYLLTRIRGQGEATTISATHDPLAEIVEIELPAGASCVLQSRALAAVRQPIGKQLRVRSHWRLFSLNAWLTMQLRYLSFSGPGSLIVKGGRGVRVEQAKEGRIFGQDQLVGFSADLAYSVTRTETFMPYLFGHESLLKDKVHEGEGIIIIEEAPFSARTGRGVRSGLEGMFDASLKVFGL